MSRPPRLVVSDRWFLDPAEAGWANRREDWLWSSVDDDTGNITDAPVIPSGLLIDRVLLPGDPHQHA